MLVTITQARRLTGKARKTLYAPAKAGKLSLSKFGDGRTAVDTSELHRCYGDFKENVTVETLPIAKNVTNGNDVLNVLCELKKENTLMREEMHKLREEIKNLNNRLEYKPAKSVQGGNPESSQNKTGESYSSLVAKLKAKQNKLDK